MKHLYIITSLLALLALGCKKDNSTGATHPLPPLVMSGLESDYSVYTHRDTLRISPTVQNEDQYEYSWTAFSAVFVQNTGKVPFADTIGRTKDLNYPMMLKPGAYILVFNVKDKKTGVIKEINVNMNVATLNMNGWYLLKDNGGKTDFDFIYPNGRIDNWISFYNQGKSLDGNAVKAVFVPNFKMAFNSTDLFGTFAVISDKDAGIYRIDNGALVYGFNDMFFLPPATHKLQNVFTSMSGTNVGLINDNQAYSMTKGALFTNMPNTYTPSPVATVGGLDIGFDLTSKSIFLYNGASYAAVPANAASLKNMNADVLWMNGYAGTRSVAMMLFRLSDTRGLLVKLNATYTALAGYVSPMVLGTDTLSPTHGLMQANVIGGNYDADYIYYAVNNNVYLTDFATTQENLQVTLPAGEMVTCIQHIKYPQPVSANVPTTTDYLAIASYANGHYKVWLHKISSTGTLDVMAQPTFEGDGRVTNVTYMEQGLGSRTF